MILLFFYIFQVSPKPKNEHSYNTTFCICVDRKDVNCSNVCKNFRKIGYKNKEILKITQKYKEPKITFLIYGTTDSKKPEFDLSEYTNISLNIVSATKKRENIILNGFDKNSNYYNLNGDEFYQINHNHKNDNSDIADEIYSHFFNLNIYFNKEKYLFNHLMLYNTFFLPNSDSALSKKTSILQNFLTSDFISMSNIPNEIKYISPSHRLQIICNESVNQIHFFEDHQILLQSNQSFYNCSVNLRNLKKNIRANIVLVSRNLTMTFEFMPTNEDEIPKIDFKLKKSAKIFVNTNDKQFDNKLMKISNIRFIHGSASIYFSSNNGISIPTFDEEGVGTVYKNDEVSQFSTTYCICEGDDCQSNCRRFSENIIPYDIRSIDKTVIGNPSNTLKYIISNSKEDKGKHPIFDLEHFGDKTLTVIGITKDEHIEFVGDGSDDIGVFSFTNLIFHGNNLFFPEVFLHDVNIAKMSENSSIILNSTLLKSDVSTLKNIFNANVTIVEPLNGYEIHTTNILNQVTLLIMPSKRLKIDNSLVISFSRKTTIKIFGSGIVNIFLEKDNEKLHQRLNLLPNLRIYLEGDKNIVTFPGNPWPESLRDISSKLTLIHGENDVYVNGETIYGNDPENPEYKTIPPIVDHEGTGAFFLNGKLSNYAEKYCICEEIENEDTSNETIKNDSNNCENLCQDYGPVVGFSSSETEEIAIGNPIRSIQYFIVQSSKKKHPIFDLIKFSEKSFSIVGIGPNKQYVSLVGTSSPIFTSSSISHLFHNVNIEFSSLGFYFFNNVEFSNCSFYENITFANLTEKEKNKMIELKKNSIKIYHSGMTIDISSLKSIYEISRHLIYPSKNYLKIDGLGELKGISLDSSRYVSLYDNVEMENGYLIDVSMLSLPVQLSTSFGTSIDKPFFVYIKDGTFRSVDEIPPIFIDVSEVPETDSYLMFTGRKKWDNEFHNLANKITVSYGQTNIHLITKVANYKRELPPHVNLIGDGEYYINNEKQGSVFAPGNSIESDDDRIEESRWSFLSILTLILFISTAGFFVYYVYDKIRKNRREQTFFDRWKDEAKRMLSESDISLSHLEIDLEDVNMSE